MRFNFIGIWYLPHDFYQTGVKPFTNILLTQLWWLCHVDHSIEHTHIILLEQSCLIGVRSSITCWFLCHLWVHLVIEMMLSVTYESWWVCSWWLWGAKSISDCPLIEPWGHSHWDQCSWIGSLTQWSLAFQWESKQWCVIWHRRCCT